MRRLRKRVEDLEARVDALEALHQDAPEEPPVVTVPEWVAGVDAYHRTGAVDWAKVRGAGYRFAILKATEGVGYLETQSRRDWFVRATREAKAAGLLVSFYHFGRPDTGPNATLDAQLEAQDFLAAIELAGGPTKGAPVWLDLEKDATETRTRAEVQDWLGEFLGLVDRVHPCGLYTSDRWMDRNTADPAAFALLPNLARRQCWVARYAQNDGGQWIDERPDWVEDYPPEDKVPPGFTLDIHQHGSRVPVPGYPAPGDANISTGQIWVEWGVDPALLAD